MKNTKKIRPSKHKMSEAHMNSERLHQLAQNLHWPKPEWDPALTGEVDKAPMATPEANSNCQLFKK